MSNYSNDPASVRVDFFKPNSNKWYCTEAVHWLYYHANTADIFEAFRSSLKAHLCKDEKGNHIRLAGMTAVCLEPYHEHQYPLMIKVPGCYQCGKLSGCDC